MDTTDWARLAGSVAAAAAIAPWLASMTHSLTTPDGETPRRWWAPRRITTSRWAIVTAVAVILAVPAGLARPTAAWWLLACGGTALAIIDIHTHKLPARLAYPTGAAVGAVLIATGLTAGEYHRLARAGLAVLIVGTAWLLLAFLAGGDIGLGDVRLAALTAAPLGWAGWSTLVTAQLVLVLLAAGAAVIVLIARPQLRGWRMPVPLGPALVVAPLIAAIL